MKLTKYEKIPQIKTYSLRGGDFVFAYPDNQHNPVAVLDVKEQQVYINSNTMLDEQQYVKTLLVSQGVDNCTAQYPENDCFEFHLLCIQSRWSKRADQVFLAGLRWWFLTLLIMSSLALGVEQFDNNKLTVDPGHSDKSSLALGVEQFDNNKLTVDPGHSDKNGTILPLL